MHNAALAALVPTEHRLRGWKYHRFDIEPERLGEALALMRRHGFRGVNLTVPHKVLAVGIVSRSDAIAKDAGAVNTLVASEEGWHGFNTDGYGLAAAIREDLGLSLRGARVVLLGAGGAARAAAAECLRAGCAGLWISNRTRSKRDALVADLAPLAVPGILHALEPGAPPGRDALVINATSLGLHPEDAPPADLRSLGNPSAVYDMIYNPPLTRLLAQARDLGIPYASGLGMLAHQGAKSLEIWTGVPAERTAPLMRAAAANALG